MVLFGVSNMLSDIYECAMHVGKKITSIVVNETEKNRDRTKNYKTRLWELDERPNIVPLDDFAPLQGEEYFVVPTTPKKSVLVKFLKERYQLQFSKLIHPSSCISSYAHIGEDVFVGANSVIGPGSEVRNHVYIQSGVTIGHDCVLNEYVRVNPGSNIAGHVEIHNGAMIGLGANIIEELVIGRGAVIAAGAVVIKDVKEYTMVAGVPAIVKKRYKDVAVV